MTGHGPPFSNDEMREIEQARESFRAYVEKGRPYPREEDDGQSFERGRQASTPRTGPANDLTPIRAALADLRNTLNQHIDASKKKPKKEFKGIKE